MQIAYLNSKIGCIELKGDKKGLNSLSFVKNVGKNSFEINFILKSLQQLELYFDKKVHSFDVPLNLIGTDFQKKVWNTLLQIPYGTTTSYSHIAKMLGDVNKTRAVGMANSKNPISIIVPCHRVIGSNGSLTGYAGGLERKKWLLKFEGAIKQTSLF